MSPCCKVSAYSTPSKLTKPVKMEPCTTINVSLDKGWVWGGTTPPIPKSSRTWEMPSVLRAGYSNTVANDA